MAESKGYIVNSHDRGSLNISEDVVAIIAAAATADVEGVYGPFISPGKEYSGIVGRKGLVKGVKICIDNDTIVIEINIIVEIGFAVSEVGEKVQKAIASAIEDSVGTKVSAVNVNICGIALKKK